jgi:microcin C transport system permease protein
MIGYILRRIALMVPTLLGILLINFVIIQAAPGGPVEQLIVKLTTPGAGGASSRMSGGGDLGGAVTGSLQQAQGSYRGAQGIDPELLADINKQYGFDKPAPERFWRMLVSYAQFDFGTSFFRDTSTTSGVGTATASNRYTIPSLPASLTVVPGLADSSCA